MLQNSQAKYVLLCKKKKEASFTDGRQQATKTESICTRQAAGVELQPRDEPRFAAAHGNVHLTAYTHSSPGQVQPRGAR